MMGLAGGELVQVPEVDGAARATIMFGHDHHPELPPSGGVHGDPLQHSQATVPIEPGLYRHRPMDGDDSGDMDSHRLCLWVKVEFQWWGALHVWQLLLLTVVEGGGAVPVQEPFLQPGHVVLSRWEGDVGGGRGGQSPCWAGAWGLALHHDAIIDALVNSNPGHSAFYANLREVRAEDIVCHVEELECLPGVGQHALDGEKDCPQNVQP